jgi:DNA polymerase-3 subunit delta'
MTEAATLSVDLMPWLKTAQERLRRTHASGRMPHGLLIQAAPGLGSEWLARWAAALVMCADPAKAPCGACRACVQLAAATHPDFTWIVREEDARQLSVDQIRELCGAMALKSYGGGYKVAVIAEADAMNVNAANALLKTLEEPPPFTLLVLCSSRPSRLPATIVSRCQQVRVPKPAPAAALEWLNARQPRKDWPDILEHAAGAPLKALELADGGFTQLNTDMTGALASLRERRLDIVETAERWARNDFAARLDWLETWLSRTVRAALAGDSDLPSAPRTPKIRPLYGLLDRVRILKLEQATSLNMQLAAEEWLLQAESALSA